MSCTCCIIPGDVLERLSKDRAIAKDARDASRRTLELSDRIRDVRDSACALTAASDAAGMPLVKIAATPAITVYDCKHGKTLPGRPIATPATSRDATSKRAFNETTRLAEFYKKAFGRNSIDGAGMTMMSSVHYGDKFNNAMWNGSQMVYGDGDLQLFVDFTKGSDVIGHELTHGVTQHSLQLGYEGDAGGLNESLSDCFGAMFSQWEQGQDAASADWLIGAAILGPVAKSKGYTCLRNMRNPADAHALAPQPSRYSQLTPGMDPHYTSGPPNLAFATACVQAGGRSWERIGHVWYRAMTGFGTTPALSMKDFANRTRSVAKQLSGTDAVVPSAVDAGWKAVGL